MAEARLLHGKPIADIVRAEIRAARDAAGEGGGGGGAAPTPRLAVVVASADPAVRRYAEAKRRAAEALGLALDTVTIDPAAGQGALEDAIDRLSEDQDVHGIILELPLDPGLDAQAAILRLDPLKDVDGLTPYNLGLIAAGRESEALLPATPLACIRLAESVAPLAGKRACVIGRGPAVGRPLAPMLVNRDATVTICHSRTPDLAAAIAPCDLVFVAAGRPGLVTGDMVRPGQIVIDAGISVIEGRVTGDVDAASVMPKVAAMTPVPGGVGPLTATLIFANLLRAAALQRRAEGRP